MRIYIKIFVLLSVFFVDQIAAVEDPVTAFGHKLAGWCRKMVGTRAEREPLNQLVPLFGKPAVFNEIPAELKDTVEHGVRRVLNALYKLRDRLVVDERFEEMRRKWLLMDMSASVEIQPVSMEQNNSRAFTNTLSNNKPNGVYVNFDYADQLGARQELARRQRQKSANDRAKNMFPINPSKIAYNKDKQMLKQDLENLGEFLEKKLAVAKPPKMDEIVGIVGAHQIGMEIQNGRKRKESAKTRLNNAMRTAFEALIKGNKTNVQAQPNRNFDPKKAVNESMDKTFEKCTLLAQLLEANEYEHNQLQIVQRKLLENIPAEEGEKKKIYRAASDVFDTVEQKAVLVKQTSVSRGNVRLNRDGSKRARHA